MKRPLGIAGLALLLLGAAATLLGALIFMLLREGSWVEFQFIVVVSAGLLLGVWFLSALALGLWDLSIDAWWVVVSFFVLWVVICCWGTVSDGMRGSGVEWGVFWTGAGTLPLIYMFRIRRFFNGPLSLNALADKAR